MAKGFQETGQPANGISSGKNRRQLIVFAKRRTSNWWPLVILFPIPFCPWSLTIVCVGLFGWLSYVFTREEGALVIRKDNVQRI